MTRRRPGEGCFDLGFQAGYPIGEPGEVALEDYVRAVARAEGAEAVRSQEDPGRVTGVHVCGMQGGLSADLLNEIEGFARSLAIRTEAGGLGWS